MKCNKNVYFYVLCVYKQTVTIDRFTIAALFSPIQSQISLSCFVEPSSAILEHRVHRIRTNRLEVVFLTPVFCYSKKTTKLRMSILQVILHAPYLEYNYYSIKLQQNECKLCTKSLEIYWQIKLKCTFVYLTK